MALIEFSCGSLKRMLNKLNNFFRFYILYGTFHLSMFLINQYAYRDFDSDADIENCLKVLSYVSLISFILAYFIAISSLVWKSLTEYKLCIYSFHTILFALSNIYWYAFHVLQSYKFVEIILFKEQFEDTFYFIIGNVMFAAVQTVMWVQYTVSRNHDRCVEMSVLNQNVSEV